MSNKSTAEAPANIAFIKYWGVKDEVLRLPANGSISMNLSNLLTITTVEFNNSFKEDAVIVDGKKESIKSNRVIKHINRIRKLAKIRSKVKVVSENNFPSSTGLSSSASGFAALTLAAISTSGLDFSEKDLSILARLGSGSACRSIPDGFVEWVESNTHETSYAKSLFPPDYWDIVDVVVVVSSDKKDISSTEGHKFAGTSIFFEKRMEIINEKIKTIKEYMEKKNFKAFGELIEKEALELHAIYLTSSPSLIYLTPESLCVIREVKKWRDKGILVYFTLNTGQDVHLICEKKNARKVANLAEKIEGVKKTIINYPSVGAKLSNKHLF